MMDKYEELNLNNYVESDNTKMVFGNGQILEAGTIKEQVSAMCDGLRNPYFNLYHWAKGELMDIESLVNALMTKDKMSEKILKNERRKMSTREDIDNMKAGRKSIKTMFKKDGDTHKMEQQVENVSLWSFIF